ncbi:MAG: tRNA threonylcarbamoyladenosine dehydratase [Ruminococcaceae bacterium]|nr:tRNA threonylcarbamoyladenosine dehydratase [Oscillospiraceae bacterium]
MDRRFERTELLFGKDAMEKLKNKRVLVVGTGGVGGFAVEAIARCGVGNIDLLDFDTVDITNINRQIIALESTVGRKKVEVCAERVREINPYCNVGVFDMFYSAETAEEVFKNHYDYIVDAIDIVTSKLHLIQTAHEKNIPIISALGTGNKSDPMKFKITDISKTSVCPLAKVVRRELKARGIPHTKVLFSEEIPMKISQENGKMVASNSFTPSIAGLLIGREVVLDLIKE